MARFRVLVGQHSEKDAQGVPHLYNPGDIVDSKSNLLKFNSPGSVKFELVDDPESARGARGETERPVGPGAVSQAPGGQVSTGFQQAGRPRTERTPELPSRGVPVANPGRMAGASPGPGGAIPAPDFPVGGPTETLEEAAQRQQLQGQDVSTQPQAKDPAQGPQGTAKAGTLAQRLEGTNLEGMTNKQLDDFAAAEEINIQGATNKEEKIKRIRAAGSK